MATPTATQASSTQPASPSLKLLFRQLIKSYSKAAAIFATNVTDASWSRASLSSSAATAL
jgi:hypothetical protein